MGGRQPGANLSIQKFGPSLVVAIVLVVLFVTAGGVISTHISSERTANVAVEQTLAEGQSEVLELERVQSKFSAEPIFSGPREVIVIVRGPPDRDYPGLSDRISDRIQALSDQNTVVHVEFVSNQRSSSETTDEQASERVIRPGSVATPAGLFDTCAFRSARLH